MQVAGFAGGVEHKCKGKIFATLGYPEKGWAMVKLRPHQQREFVQADPESFVEVKGAWGRRGSTNVRLRVTTAKTLKTSPGCGMEKRGAEGSAKRLLSA